MKKTIICVLGLCLSAFALADSYTTASGTSGGSYNFAGWTMTWGTSALTTTLTDTNTTATLASKVALDSIFIEAAEKKPSTDFNNVKLAIYEASVSETGAVTLTDFVGLSTTTTGTWTSGATTTFDFSGTVLETGTTYTFAFVKSTYEADGATMNVTSDYLSTVSNYAGVATRYRASVASIPNSDLYVYASSGRSVNVTNATTIYAGSIYGQYTTHSIPEPATATLSLLALAGLAARRRRK